MQKFVITANPFRCRMWALHDRLDEYVTEESCVAEIDSFARHGQLVPVLARPTRGDPEYDFELIYGARRLFIARHLNKPLLLDVQDLSDQAAIVAMDIENRHRKDVSPYERALSYARWLRSGQFKSQSDLARALRVSGAHVSRYLKLARLPSVIASAFSSPLEICEGWGLDLVNAWEDPKRKPLLAAKARAITAAAQKLPASEIYTRLMACGARRSSARSSNRDEVVQDCHSRPLFRIRHRRKTVSVELPREQISPLVLDRIRRALVEALQAVNPQHPDATNENTTVGLRAPEVPTDEGTSSRALERLYVV